MTQATLQAHGAFISPRPRAATRPTPGTRLNWGGLAALGLNLLLWAGTILAARALLP